MDSSANLYIILRILFKGLIENNIIAFSKAMLNISISVITVRPIKPLSTRHCGQRRHSFTPSVVRARPPESRVQTDQQRCYMSQQRCARSGVGMWVGPMTSAAKAQRPKRREGGRDEEARGLSSPQSFQFEVTVQRATCASCVVVAFTVGFTSKSLQLSKPGE